MKRNFSENTDKPVIPSVLWICYILQGKLLAEAGRCHYHVCHVSTKFGSVIRDCETRWNEDAEVTRAFHLVLCEDDIPSADPNLKWTHRFVEKKTMPGS